jgi:serine phosphatase RsbU (regulator of sigma subunit)/DNA-binding LacI/PurR family transcriptional regulator
MRGLTFSRRELAFMSNKTVMPSHPVIGLLIEGITGPYQSGIWPGIADAVRKSGVQLQCYCGGALEMSPLNPWESQRNFIFNTAEKKEIDGYIISGSLGGYIPRERFIKFIERFTNKPVVSLIPITESIPAVYVDNHKGIHDLVTHLICNHGYSKFAFIRGPEGNAEAEERFSIFKEVISRHNIALNHDAVINGDFTRESGRKAAEYILDRKLKVDAVIACTDEIAIGCLNAFNERGIDVPDDIALVGFDDIPESGVTSPPITTVHQPMFEIGKIAVEMLLGLIRGDSIPSTSVLDTVLKIRRSCGCFCSVMPEEKKINFSTCDMSHKGRNEKISFMPSVNPAIADRAKKIWRCFINDIDIMKKTSFLKEVDCLGDEARAGTELSDDWNVFFAGLSYFAGRHYSGDKLVFAYSLLFESSLIRVEVAKRMERYRIIASAGENVALRKLGQSLANTAKTELLYDAAIKLLPKFGLETFFIILYNRSGRTEKLNYSLICINGRRHQQIISKVKKTGLMSGLSEVFVPANPSIFIIEPLHYQKDCFGMLAVEADPFVNPEKYRIIAEYLSGALHSTFLIEKIQHQTTVLEQANMELARLQMKEHAYLEAVNRELENGRKIQMGFLPESLPQPKGWEVVFSFVPARAVSGDFYDTFMLDDNHIAFTIADVSGKDVSAALFMALNCTLIRILTEKLYSEGNDPLDAVRLINEYVLSHYSQMHDRQMYTTLFLGVIDVSSGTLNYCNAGHYAPLLISPDSNEFIKLPHTGPAIGLMKEAVFVKKNILIGNGAILFSYTDGVTDARSPDGTQFSSQRLFEILKEPAVTAADKLSLVETALSSHINGAEPSDDITILVIRRA